MPTQMRDPIYILGIHDGHNCGATLTRNGRIVASVSEERLTRVKNEVGYPRRAIDEVLRIGGIEASALREIAYASLFMHSRGHLSEIESWYDVGIEQQRHDFAQPNNYQKVIFENRKQERIRDVADHLGIPDSRVCFVEHHRAHLAAGYYTAPNIKPNQPCLGLTCDGSGDGIAGSVSVCTGNQIRRLEVIDRHASLGKIYSRVTLLLGMKPWEHEYKIMGLAPYADPGRSDDAAGKLRALIKLDGITFKRTGELSTNYCYRYLRDAFERVRFDTISGATQLFTEEMLVNWIRAAIKKTGIGDIVCGGGVFMNVKANMLIAQMPEVRSIYVMPSAADESLSIGACLDRYYQQSGVVDHGESALTDLYLGGAHSRAEEETALKSLRGNGGIRIEPADDPDAKTAALLAEGEIVARCRGRMEWGARALGNRSILASSHDYRMVEKINKSIKQRDFWMPFAPSVREESAARYFDDPKRISPRFMTFAFPTKQETRGDLVAASHIRDHTIRPQVVTRDANEAYHQLLTRFERLTGRGIILNTSFNLHGEPIVASPADAIDVFLRSDLHHLALDSAVISKTANL